MASPAAETEANGTSEQQSDVASSKSAVAGSTVQQAADNIGSESLTKEPDSSAEAGSQQAQSDAEAAAAAASQAAAAAAKEKQDADAARLAAVAASASESAPKTPKTDSAISDAAAMAVLRVRDSLAVQTAAMCVSCIDRHYAVVVLAATTKLSSVAQTTGGFWQQVWQNFC